MNIKNDDIPPLFCELDELSHAIDNNQYECWREKARFVIIIKLLFNNNLLRKLY